MTEKEAILEALRGKNVQFEEYSHEPLENVMERFEKNLCFNAVVCKNLFVTTRKHDRVFLVMLRAEKKADLHELAKQMNTTHLGFAPQKMLMQILHQKAGAVGPLGILHDSEAIVEVAFDEELKNQARVAMHPSANDATVVLAFNDLQRIITENGNKISFLSI